MRGRIVHVAREQLEAAVAAAVREAPDAVVAELAAVVGDIPVVMRITLRRTRLFGDGLARLLCGFCLGEHGLIMRGKLGQMLGLG